MYKKILITFLAPYIFFFTITNHTHAEGEVVPPPNQDWGFEGPFDTFDRAALQRGFQVYQEICSACHALEHLSYRHLAALGFNLDEIKAIAAAKVVPDFNDQGEPIMRPALPTDMFVDPFPNEKAARAANDGSLPADLSLIIKSRKSGADYVYALLTGYEKAPTGFDLAEGKYYNKYFPGHMIAMAPPLHDGAVTYSDGTKATTQQMTRDVVEFLAWAGEPETEERRQTGIKVILYLVFMTILFYLAKRRIWKRVKK